MRLIQLVDEDGATRVGEVDVRLGLSVDDDGDPAVSVGLEARGARPWLAAAPRHADGGGTQKASIAEAMRVSTPMATMNHPMTT